MKYIRWYDKDVELSNLMAFIENLPEETRDAVAQDLIQIILSELETNKDGELLQLGESNIKEYRRWYDKNITLHSAVEIIKNLPQEQRELIVASIMESIVQILAEQVSNE